MEKDHTVCLLAFIIIFSGVTAHVSVADDNILFEDPLNGTQVKGWKTAPKTFTKRSKYGKVFVFRCPGETINYKTSPRAGDESWKNYRIEVEVLPVGKQGFIGINYNLQDHGYYGCNMHFAVGEETIHLQSMGVYGNTHGSWKLWPVSQRKVTRRFGKWMKLRIDVGETFANVYVDDNPECIYTIYDLPFQSGGINFWASYYSTAYFRNLKVTRLPENSTKPELEDIWQKTSKLNIIKEWQITKMLPASAGRSGLPDEIVSDNISWEKKKTDRRGILNLSEIYPDYKQNTIFAKTVIQSDRDAEKRCFITYTDRFSLWCNGKPVFEGPDRNWFNKNRQKTGNSRLIPDQYEVTLPLEKGSNTVIIRSEALEEFGWGFWMRTE